MQNAKIVIDILNKRSLLNLEINNIYKCLYNPEFYLIAYNKLVNNKGSLTPGETNETIDGMSLERINKIIEEMKFERYKWHKTRQIDIPKSNGGFRTLGVTEWRDKLVQEVLRMILSAIYEPKFSDSSHGFRPGRGCYTALKRIYTQGIACEFFIEGDISKCFDSIDHEILLNILKRDIKDGRFIELIRKMLKAGKFGNDFVYGKTYSGTPQGGVLSPLLANIYLNELDQWIEKTLVPWWNRLDKRPISKTYQNIQSKASHRAIKYRKNKDPKLLCEIRQFKKEMRKYPSKISLYKTGYRRLSYTRYANDWIISFTGTYEEAQSIKIQIREFLKKILKLELNDEKTKITKSDDRDNPARFLGYNLITQWNNNKLTNRIRKLCGNIGFIIPHDVISKYYSKYCKNRKPRSFDHLIHEEDYDIVSKFQLEFIGIVQYYKLARNLGKLFKIKWIIQNAMLRTLANKHKTSVAKLVKKYKKWKIINGKRYSVIEVSYVKNGKSISKYFGGISLERTSVNNVSNITDNIITFNFPRSSVAEKLLNNKCEICGSTDRVEIHHIKHLKNIKKSKEPWALRMIALNRKTIALCHKHHCEVHKGKYNDRKLR